MRFLASLVLFSVTSLAACVTTSTDESASRRDPHPAGECFVGGCSSQICSDTPDVVSTCEWTDAYACYQDATCERQADGQCGWTETPELQDCLASD
jgi:hypothetical protein